MSKNYKPILVVHGEPNSIFLEIFFKSLKVKKYKSPIILISSRKLLELQMKKLKFNMKINIINTKNLDNQKLYYNSINLIDIKFNQKKAFEKISSKSNKFIENSFLAAFEIIKSGITNKFINGPISKKYFLGKKHLGITEYISKKFSIKQNSMLIYNKKLSVSPITTHLPLKHVTKNLNKKNISEKIGLINSFYKNFLGFTPKIAVLGVNPHCESVHKFNEDEKILKPVLQKLKKNIKFLDPYLQIQFF